MDSGVDTQEIAPARNSKQEIQAPVYTPKNNNRVGSYILRGLALLGLVVSTNAIAGCGNGGLGAGEEIDQKVGAETGHMQDIRDQMDAQLGITKGKPTPTPKIGSSR